MNKLREIKARQDHGLTLSEIQKVMTRNERAELAPLREIWIRYPVSEGIEIHIRRDLEEKERKKLAEIFRVAGSIIRGGNVNEE